MVLSLRHGSRRVGDALLVLALAVAGVASAPPKSAAASTEPRQVADINPRGSSAPGSWAVLGDSVYFAASDGSPGRELWRSNAAGAFRVADINPGSGGSSPDGLTVFGGYLYFAANEPATGVELWRTDGTVTRRVKDIYPGATSSFPAGFARLGDYL